MDDIFRKIIKKYSDETQDSLLRVFVSDMFKQNSFKPYQRIQYLALTKDNELSIEEKIYNVYDNSINNIIDECIRRCEKYGGTFVTLLSPTIDFIKDINLLIDLIEDLTDIKVKFRKVNDSSIRIFYLLKNEQICKQ